MWSLKFTEGHKNVKDTGICVKNYSKTTFNFHARRIRMLVLNKTTNNIILDFPHPGNSVLVLFYFCFIFWYFDKSYYFINQKKVVIKKYDRMLVTPKRVAYNK